MGLFSGLFAPLVRERTATQSAPQTSTRPKARPPPGPKKTSQTSRKASVSTITQRSLRDLSTVSSSAAISKNLANGHAARRAAFERWSSAPIEVQQDVERCIRDDELLRRQCESYNAHRAHQIDDTEAEFHEAFTRSLKRRLRRINTK